MIPIIYEDKEIIIVNKPPGMPSAKDRTKAIDVRTTVERYLCDSSSNDEKIEPYVELVHRLDRPVGGLLILAKNKLANNNTSKKL